MSRKTLLFLGADHFLAYNWTGGILSEGQRFADTVEDKEKFSAFLETHRDPVYLLADLIEEDFRHESVPHLRGRERNELLQRKFEQYYRNTPFRQALPLRRQKEGRRDDDILFSALTNPALITPWMGVMLARAIPVAGIYSVPNISAPLVKDLTSQHLLLLSWEKHAGLRQTYFDNKLLRFSRLTPMSGGKTFSEAVAMEAARTQQYLKSLSLLPFGQILEVHVICHADDKTELASRLRDSVDMHYIYLDIQQMGQRIDYKGDLNESDATPLFLHLLATKPALSHYASAEHTHFFQLRQLRQGMQWLSGLIATVCLLWGATSLYEGRALHEESGAFKLLADKVGLQTQQITQGFPNTLANASDMKTAVLATRKLTMYAPAPQTVINGISTALDAFPRIRVDKLSWQTSTGPNGTAPDILGPHALLPATSGGIAQDVPAQVILLNGELVDFGMDYRNALAYLENFQKALVQRGYAVMALSLPLDVSPTGSITPNDSADTKPAQFSLKMVWRPTS